MNDEALNWSVEFSNNETLIYEGFTRSDLVDALCKETTIDYYAININIIE